MEMPPFGVFARIDPPPAWVESLGSTSMPPIAVMRMERLAPPPPARPPDVRQRMTAAAANLVRDTVLYGGTVRVAVDAAMPGGALEVRGPEGQRVRVVDIGDEDYEPPYTGDEPLGTCVIHGDYWTPDCDRCR